MCAIFSVQAEDLCMDGTLLFREDFGGNDPNDPVAGVNPAPGMTSSYTQIFDTATCIAHYPCTGMGSGRYLLTKIGYRNADSYTYSHWFIMDDHTYPNDKTRGYLLEIDGRTDNATLFETVIDGLCAGTKLTFSAYVANVTTSYSYDHGNNGDPQLSFVLLDPKTDTELTNPYKTGPIPVDRSYQGMSGEWRNSAHWQLVGMNFTVPEGRTAIKLVIRNACTAYNGNDFAMDDIEIRLCAPPVTIDGENEVRENAATTLRANFTNDGTFPEPLEYKWWFSADSLTWSELKETTNMLPLPNVKKADSGWYQVAVSGSGNIESVNCRAISRPFRLTVKTYAPQTDNLCMDGTLLFREDFGGNDPSDPKISTTAVPGMSYRQTTTDVLGSMKGGKYLVTKQGYCNGNGTSQWHLQDDHTHFGDLTRGYLLEIDGQGDNAAFYSTTIDGLCEGSKLTFSAFVANVMTWGMYVGSPGVYAYPRLKFVLTNPFTGAELKAYDTGDIPYDASYTGDNMCWQHSSEWQLVGMNFTVPPGQTSIKLTIYNNATGTTGNDFAIDDIEIHLCAPPVTIDGENELCAKETATLTADFTNDGTFPEPLEYKWWFSADSLTWSDLNETSETLTIPNTQKADSGWYQVAVSGSDNIESVNCRAISEPVLLAIKECEPPCPDYLTITADTIVCDTLMPYRWRDTLFTEPAKYEIMLQNEQDCDSVLYVLTLDTVHCEQSKQDCYPIIVNKYNWVLLVDNVKVRELFPSRMVLAYQWYKNGEPISGANEDDYSEYEELRGEFQMILTLDGDEEVCSNILKINTTEQVNLPVQVNIYDCRGLPVPANQITHGIYLYRYEQGDKVWTEKKFIP